jgi:hypothetical protein
VDIPPIPVLDLGGGTPPAATVPEPAALPPGKPIPQGRP